MTSTGSTGPIPWRGWSIIRTAYNQYDLLGPPLQASLEARRVRLVRNGKVTEIEHKLVDGQFVVTGIGCLREGRNEVLTVNNGDFVFLQNGSMTDACSLGPMTSAPGKLTKADSGGWTLWETLGRGRPQFGNPGV